MAQVLGEVAVDIAADLRFTLVGVDHQPIHIRRACRRQCDEQTARYCPTASFA